MSDRYARRIYLALAEGSDLTADQEHHLAGCRACQAAAGRAREFEGSLHAELLERRAPMPADPFSVAEAPRRRGILGPAAAAVAVLAVAVFGGALLAGQNLGPTPSASVAPSPAAVASPHPSSTADPTATIPPTPSVAATLAPSALLQPDQFATWRGRMTLYDSPNGTPLAEVPDYGSEVYVIAVRDGWYEVQAFALPWRTHVFGWLPSTTYSDDPNAPEPSLVVADPGPCAQPEAGMRHRLLSSGLPQHNLRCFGADELVVRGYAIAGSVGRHDAYAGSPRWMMESAALELSTAIGPAATGLSLLIHVPPELDATIPTSDRDGFEGTLLEITGHFDDPRAGGCRLEPLVAGAEVRPGLAELWCRQRFVVDRVEVVPSEE